MSPRSASSNPDMSIVPISKCSARSSYDQSAWAKVVSYLSVVTHFEPFSKGVMDSKDIIFYLSMIFFGLFLTARSVESLRWRA